MKKITLSVFVLSFALVAPMVHASECEDMANEYNSAFSSIGGALTAYQACVEASQGQQDCASEFKALDEAQGKYEKAVGSVKAACK